MSKREKLGFENALEYILDFLCYAYYVKSDNIVSDCTFDELEKIYCILTEMNTAPMRGNERGEAYGYGVKFLYDEYAKRKIDYKPLENKGL
jgi:hypothetical protein